MTKKQLIEYMQSKYVKAMDIYEKSCEAFAQLSKELTIHRQLQKLSEIFTVPVWLDEATINKFEKVNDDIHLTLDATETVLFGAEIVEQEIDILNSCIRNFELYKNGNLYELHLLLMKRDENLVESYHYATLTFKDMKKL